MIDREYSGNPMVDHLGVKGIAIAHFQVWLEIFDQSVRETVGSGKAQIMSRLAHRIGRALSTGIGNRLRNQKY